MSGWSVSFRTSLSLVISSGLFSNSNGRSSPDSDVYTEVGELLFLLRKRSRVVQKKNQILEHFDPEKQVFPAGSPHNNFSVPSLTFVLQLGVGCAPRFETSHPSNWTSFCRRRHIVKAPCIWPEHLKSRCAELNNSSSVIYVESNRHQTQKRRRPAGSLRQKKSSFGVDIVRSVLSFFPEELSRVLNRMEKRHILPVRSLLK